MTRYIDAENAISVLEILAEKCADDKAFEQAISVLKDVPTADVVKAVRCKECKWHGKLCGEGFCSNFSITGFENDDYCSYGERREDE